jgi:hypothetical protein
MIGFYMSLLLITSKLNFDIFCSKEFINKKEYAVLKVKKKLKIFYNFIIGNK